MKNKEIKAYEVKANKQVTIEDCEKMKKLGYATIVNDGEFKGFEFEV